MTQNDGWSARRPLAMGWAALAILIFGFGSWALLTSLSGAIIATGQVDVERSRQPVQHPDGGQAEAVMISEGELVQAGQILLRLDGTGLRSELALIEAELAGILTQRNRLEAERDDQPQIVFAAALTEAAAHPQATALMAAQKRLFATRAEGFRSRRDQLTRQSDQISDQAHGLDAQIAAATRQLALARQELATQQALLGRGLTVSARVLAPEREVVRLMGVLGGYQAAKAETASRIAETALAQLHLTATRREDALSELRSLGARETELTERRRALRIRIDGLTLRAPVAGIVLGLLVPVPGTVLKPAETALYIVPQNRPFVVEARIAPTDIDAVAMGQPATLRIAAFDSRTSPDLVGRVTEISPDAFFDQSTGASYYRVEIEMTPEETPVQPPAPLLPGMPVEVFLLTRDRSPMSYLLEPLTVFLGRSFRES